MATSPLNQVQYQIVRDRVRAHQSLTAFVEVRGEEVPINITGYDPAHPQCLVITNEGGRTAKVPYTAIRIDEETAASLTTAVAERESSRAMAMVYAMRSHQGRRINGQFGGWRQGQ